MPLQKSFRADEKYAPRTDPFRVSLRDADKQKGELSVSEQLALSTPNVALVIQISSRRFNCGTIRSRWVKSSKDGRQSRCSALASSGMRTDVRRSRVHIRLSRPVLRLIRPKLRFSPGSTLARGNFASKVERLKFQQRPERRVHSANLQSAAIGAFEDVSLVFRFRWLRPASGHSSSFFGVLSVTS